MKKLILLFVAGLTMINSGLFSQSTNDVLNLLIQNKVISQSDADSIRSEAAIKQQETDARRKLFPVNASKVFQIAGYTQVRYQVDDAPGKINGFDIRRAYLNISGVLSPYWSYRLQADFATSPKLIDAYTELKINDYFNFTIGQALIPFSLNNVTSNNKLDLIERAQVVDAMVGRSNDVIGNQNGRDIGIQLGGSFLKINNLSLIEYKIAVLNGSGINGTDKNEAKDISTRILLHPFNGLAVGLSYYNGLGTFGTPAKSRARLRTGYELSYDLKNLSVRAEYINGKDATVKKEGYYAQVGYFMVPQKFQILTKVDAFDPDLSTSNDKSTWYVVGANYFFNPSVKLQLNYTFKEEQANSFNNNLASLQLQVAF